MQRPPKISYHYQPLEAGYIRLLVLHPRSKNTAQPEQITCDLLPIPLSKAMGYKYEALSYAWGTQDRDQDVKIKSQANRVIAVTPSLHAALERLHSSDEQRLLWIDQLCINQENLTEREDQVARMRDIYRKAKRAVVWLGEHEGDTDLLRDMYDQLSFLPPTKKDVNIIVKSNHEILRTLIGLGADGDDRSQGRLEVLERFLNRAWFRRAWVYQEAVVAPTIQVMWGNLTLPFDFIVDLVRTFFSITKTGLDEGWHKRLKSTAGFSPLRAIQHHRLERHAKVPLDFLNILWHARSHLEANDERDHVYAFLGFHPPTMSHLARGPKAGAERPIIADYKISVKDTYKRLARVMIWNSRSLEILQYVVPAKVTDEMKRLPSWVPNWAEKRFISGSPLLVPGAPHPFAASGTMAHEPDDSESSILKGRGHIISVVKKIVPHDFRQVYDFAASLKEIIKLGELLSLVESELFSTVEEVNESRKSRTLAKTIIRTLLVAGAFSLDSRMPHRLDDLLDAYDLDNGEPIKAETVVYHRQLYLRETIGVASGKRLFITSDSDIGLGYRTMREGDLICIIYGSKMPCVLRKSSRVAGHYTFVGHCYVEGWMFGDRNPRGWAWWNSEPRCFRLL